MRQDTDINQLVTETLSETSIPENITVTSDLVEGLSPVSIDAIQVGQIFLNLIENGVHAMVEGGTLDISSRMEEGVIEVIFVDKGCGISRENMEKIFEPLFTTKAKGIGLGLSISKSLAKANGATILVESEDGKGSRFTVRFRD
ncbi:MAG: PAS domain-containing sensor histidine kinase, partial [Desulfobulbaceae bacterium]|nr:PAS domain-containing sensor histidine kinase [Desulfobulbaceae bacterium]